MEKRKLFKFYSSYYDVANELDDKNRLAFYDAIMKRQFTGVETELQGMAKFAYISQKHSIDKQIEGWEFKMKTSLFDEEIKPIVGGIVGGVQGGSVQEEVEEKEEVEVEYTIPSAKAEKIDFEKLIEFINKNTGRGFKVINKTIKGKYLARLKDGYSKQDILDAVSNAVKNDYHKGENFKYLTPEFFSRSETLDKYSNTKKETSEPKPQKTEVTYSGPFHN